MTSRGFDRKAVAGRTPEPERRVEVLVVGGGDAGASAAIEAARAGASVLLVDEHPVGAGLMGMDAPLYWGGRYTQAVHNKARLIEQVFATRPRLQEAFEAGAEVELGVACWGAFLPGYGLASLPEPLAGLADEERAWMVGFERLIIAAGGRDVAFAFEGWDQPGVMGARALESLTEVYDAFAGRRLAILGAGGLALNTLRLAQARGLEVAAVIDVEREASMALLDEARAAGAEVLLGAAPIAARGGVDGVEALEVVDLADGARRVIACDTIVQAISLTPVIELLDALGGAVAMAETLGGHAPASPDGNATSRPEVFVAGEAAGTPGGGPLDPEAAAGSGRRAAQLALASLGRAADLETAAWPPTAADALARQEAWTRALMASGGPDVVVCQCEAVTRGDLLEVRQPRYLGEPSPALARRDLQRLIEDGPMSPDQIKRLTRACMGPCQARRCREQVALTIACASNTPAARAPLAGYRPPVRPLPLGVLAAWDEARAMSAHWDVWFGIAGQWTPYADAGTDREALYADILGSDSHL
jgi:thioredoxin reductase